MRASLRLRKWVFSSWHRRSSCKYTAVEESPGPDWKAICAPRVAAPGVAKTLTWFQTHELRRMGHTSRVIFVRRIRSDDFALARDLRLRALKSDPLSFGSSYAREVSHDETF